jgi:dienelactone hydrolase
MAHRTIPGVTAHPLGNLHAFVSAIADHAWPALSFEHSGTSLSEWRESARQRALDLLRYAPPPMALAPELIERVDSGAYVREKIEFSSAPESRVPAYVLIPKGLTAPAPAIVGLHCHGGYYVHGKEKLVGLERETPHLAQYKLSGYDGRSIADELARRGYVVIVIDAFYFGERRIDFQHMPDTLVKELQRRARFKTGVAGINEQYALLEELMARHLFAAGTTWMGILAHDDRVSVSYLLTRTEVDPHRIGCLGLSMGGMRANWLHATDPRIKAAVTSGWMIDWRHQMPAHIGRHSWTLPVPGLTGALEVSDLALLGEGAFMVQSCEQDELFARKGMHATSDRISRLFAKAGQPERATARFYDVPHQFNAAMQADAFDWLDRWLKG